MAADGTAGQFADKVAAITGGTQGLGEAIARLFAARGAAGLAICGRNVERGERIASEISGSGCPTEFVHADLERMDDCRNFVGSAEESFGRLDILVNCAAATDRGTVETTTEEIWDRLFTLNVKSQFFLIQRAVEVMRRRKIPGAIANIGTMPAGTAALSAVSAAATPSMAPLPNRSGSGSARLVQV